MSDTVEALREENRQLRAENDRLKQSCKYAFDTQNLSLTKCRHSIERYARCGEPAYHWWVSKGYPVHIMALCRTHGDEIARKHPDEVSMINQKTRGWLTCWERKHLKQGD